MYEMLAGVPPFYSENVHLMYKLIETAPVRFPATMSDVVKGLINKLLERDPKNRLCHSAAGVEELKASGPVRRRHATPAAPRGVDAAADLAGRTSLADAASVV